MALSSYGHLLKQVQSLKSENCSLRRELQDNSSHLTKLEHEACNMKDALAHLPLAVKECSARQEHEAGGHVKDDLSRLPVTGEEGSAKQEHAPPKTAVSAEPDGNYCGGEGGEEDNMEGALRKMGHKYLISLLLALHGIYAEASSCSTIQDASEGKTAILTCYFDVDLTKTQYNVNIKRYGHGGEQDWISCSWISPTDGMLCSPSHYRPLGAINKTVSFAVAGITRDMSGSYSCYTVPPRGKTNQRCDITVLAKPAVATPPSLTTHGDGPEGKSQMKEGIKAETAELSFHEMDRDHEAWIAAPLYGFIVIGLLGALLVVSIVIAVTVVVHTWRSKIVYRQYKPIPQEKTNIK